MPGTLWRAYADDAHDVSAVGILSGLARLRQQGGVIKGTADAARGVLYHSLPCPRAEPDRHRTGSNLHRLLRWMDATGEYVQEVKRMSGWRNMGRAAGEGRSRRHRRRYRIAAATLKATVTKRRSAGTRQTWNNSCARNSPVTAGRRTSSSLRGHVSNTT